MTLSKSVTGRSLGLKLLLVCGLVLLMGIPALFISLISYDRAGRANDVTREVSERYGGDQSVLGPILVAPFTTYNKEGAIAHIGQYVVFAESGNVTLDDLTTDTQQRSLYKVQTYQASADFKASFTLPENLSALNAGRTINWDRAQILIGMSDVRGLRDDVFLSVNGEAKRQFEPAISGDLQGQIGRGDDIYSKSFSSMPTVMSGTGLQYMSVNVGDLIEKGSFDVAALLPIKGAQKLTLAPFAKSTKAAVTGDWPHPGFQGKFPPETREITENGFKATWSVPFLARGIPARGPAQTLGLNSFNKRAMGIDLVQLVNPYQKVNRALKYAIMFIGLVFLAYFLFEVMIGTRVHAAQYVLIGLAQCIFYLLLLAFSEHIGFTLAFMIAAGATIAATAGYAGAVFGGTKYAVRAGIVFAGVYGLLYVLMQIEDFALMVGAITSFLAIAGTMYLTRNIDWYGITKTDA